ncbi:MAG: hypothetical protein JO138_17270 [Acidobacteriaceae bacterium]|nr:hypothetical protein [Acidobacteriaceae bacterium]
MKSRAVIGSRCPIIQDGISFVSASIATYVQTSPQIPSRSKFVWSDVLLLASDELPNLIDLDALAAKIQWKMVLTHVSLVR